MTRAQADQLLLAPSETLGMELKSWLDLGELDARGNVARALLALHNHGGGQLILGFDDKTLQPVDKGRPADVAAAYHADKVHGIVSEFIKPAIDVEVLYGERDGKLFPVIVIPGGVEYPAIARREVKDRLEQNAVYVRTLSHGRVASSKPASPEDWQRLIQTCFDNREADIARFFRRHLTGIAREIRAVPLAGSVTSAILDQGAKGYDERLVYNRTHLKDMRIAMDRWGWREVAAAIEGEVKEVKVAALLNELMPRHPRHSGWPMWVDSRQLAPVSRPYTSGNGWEAFVIMDLLPLVTIPLVDFWRLEPTGKFYHRRTYEDDVWAKVGDQRGKVIDFPLTIRRVAEALETGLAFGRVLAARPDEAALRIAFRWTNLKGRMLTAWSQPTVDLLPGTPGYADVATPELVVPLTTPTVALVPYVERLCEPLFAAFGVGPLSTAVQLIADETLQGQSTW